MKQRTLAMMTGFEQYTRKTRRAIFLEEMEQVVPWRELCALVEPHHPKPGNGRPPVEWRDAADLLLAVAHRLQRTFRGSGSTCRIRRWKRRCTTRRGWRGFWAVVLGSRQDTTGATGAKFV